MKLFRSFLYINLLLLVPLIIYGLIYSVLNKSSSRNIVKNLGWGTFSVIGIIGVPIHEICHLVANIIFGHEITKVCLYDPKGARSTGVLGYVEYNYNPSSTYQQIGLFFSGIAPMIGGSLFIMLLLRLLLPTAFTNLTLITEKISLEGIVEIFINNFKTILFTQDNTFNLVIFILLSCGISINMDISSSDLKCASKGLIMIEIILVVFSILLSMININIVPLVLQISITLIFLLTVGLIFSILSWIIFFIFSIVA